MQKSELTSFVDALDQIGVKEFSIRYEDAGRVSINNGESTLIRFKDDGAYVLEVDDNYASDGVFNIRKIDYNEIASIQTRGLNVSQTLNIVNSLGIMDDDIKSLISKRGGSRVKNTPTKSGYGSVTDKDGNNILPEGMVGRVTTGNNK
jgi:hypothetical protein